MKLSYFSKRLTAVILLYAIMFLIIFFSGELSAGIKNGINVSMNLVIPSMFIFMIFANLMIHSKWAGVLARPFRFFSRHIFKIPDQCAAIVILSLIGGYPVGAKLLGTAVRQNRMSKETAERMLCYCVNCGPAFLISGVGAGLFSSLKVGLYLYLSQIIACVTIAFLTSFGCKKEPAYALPPTAQKQLPFSVLFVSSVQDAIKSLSIICGFIVAFSGFLPVVALLFRQVSGGYAYILQGLLEVTTGCNNLITVSASNAVLWAAIFTAFGGICVYLQVYAMLYGSGIQMCKFFCYRIVYTIISVISVQIMLMLSPQTVSCIQYNTNLPKTIYSVSPLATAFMLLLAVMLLFFTKKSDKLKEQRQ